MSQGTSFGIFGGTFNPIHLGHLRAAEEVGEALGLERVLFVPSAHPPHKTSRALDPVAPASLRIEWVRAALAGNPRFAVESLEVERGGASYTVDTLGALGKGGAPELPIFIIGCDAFAELGTWREPERVCRLAHFAVMTRPPRASGTLADWLPSFLKDELVLAADGCFGQHRSASSWFRLIEISALEISSSDVRARIRSGRSVRYLLPETIRDSVERHYR